MILNEILGLGRKKPKEPNPNDVQYEPGEKATITLTRPGYGMPEVNRITAADIIPGDKFPVIEDRGDTVIVDLSNWGTKFRKVEFPKELLVKASQEKKKE